MVPPMPLHINRRITVLMESVVLDFEYHRESDLWRWISECYFQRRKYLIVFDGKNSRGQIGIVAIGVSAVIGDRCYPLVIEVCSRAVTAAVPYLNYTQSRYFSMEKTLSSRKKKKQQPEKEKAAQGLTPCAAETHWIYQFIWAACFPPWKSPRRHNLPTALSGNWISRNGIP